MITVPVSVSKEPQLYTRFTEMEMFFWMSEIRLICQKKECKYRRNSTVMIEKKDKDDCFYCTDYRQDYFK